MAQAKKKRFGLFLREMFHSLKKSEDTQINGENEDSSIQFKCLIEPSVYIPVWIIRTLAVCPEALTLYILLLSFDKGNGRVSITPKTLLSITGFNRRNLYAAIKLLENIGLIQQEKNDEKTEVVQYALLDSSPEQVEERIKMQLSK